MILSLILLSMLIILLSKYDQGLFDWSNNTGAIDVKIDRFDLQEKSLVKMLGLIFSSKLDWGSYIISIAKSASKKLEPWFILWSFFLLRLLFISINLLYAHAWNTVVTFVLVPLVVGIVSKLRIDSPAYLCRTVNP